MHSTGGSFAKPTLLELVPAARSGMYPWGDFRERYESASIEEQVAAFREFRRVNGPSMSPVDPKRLYFLSEYTLTMVMEWVSTGSSIQNHERDRRKIENALDILDPGQVDKVHLLLSYQIEEDQCMTERSELLKDVLQNMYIE